MHKGYRIDPERGIVFGIRGKPIIKQNTGGYIQAERRAGPSSRAHRLVWESVNGPIPDGMQINHRNGIKTDNRLENLELATASENTQHAYDTGLIGRRRRKRGTA
jgi:hypothetical protein